MKKAILNGSILAGDHETAHLHLQRELDLPDYYGCNLDALYDCLNDEAGPLEILIGSCGSIRAGSYGARIVETICQAAPGVRIRLGSLEPRTITEEFCRRAAGEVKL